jgi:uncharacterized membrane protein
MSKSLIKNIKGAQHDKNMGNIDRLSRTTVGVIVAILYFTEVISGTLGIVLLSLATIFVLTSLISFCPLYTLFGIQTCPSNTKG